ncbi:hypothetical protein GCM10027161_61510 [Microbispora hainanensis]
MAEEPDRPGAASVQALTGHLRHGPPAYAREGRAVASEVGEASAHLEATTDEDMLVELRKAWPGMLIVNPAFPTGPGRRTRLRPITGWGSAPA